MSGYNTGVLEPAQTQVPSLDERIRYARALADASLLPSAYRTRPANVLVAIETGHMLGIAPMAALHNIHIIEGKPTLSAALMAALVRRAGHKLRVQLSEDGSKARAQLVRADDPEFTYEAVWTFDRAKQAGLLSKDVWKKYGPNMLKNRAMSEVCRDGAQDVFLGPVYVPEELGAEVDSDGDPIIDQHSDQQKEGFKPDNIRLGTPDWDADLKALEGDRDGLRKLGELAAQYGEGEIPDGFRDRYRAAWERAKTAQHGNEPVEAELVDEDHDRCAGSGVDFSAAGWTVIAKDDGSELVMCQECDSWQWSRAGAVVEHVPGGEAR